MRRSLGRAPAQAQWELPDVTPVLSNFHLPLELLRTRCWIEASTRSGFQMANF